MLGILGFLACTTLAMAASIPGQISSNVGGMFKFLKKKLFGNN